MAKRKNKHILTAGNATIDVIVEGMSKVNEERDKVTIYSKQHTLDLVVEDPPIADGQKHRVMEDLPSVVRPISRYETPGGGGFNSVFGMRHFWDIQKDVDLTYIDISKYDTLITNALRNSDIKFDFFGMRQIPYNLVLGGRDDKIILKGPILGRMTQLKETVQRDIYSHCQGKDAILINSLKDTSFVETILDSSQKLDVPVYTVVTTSLEREFVHDRVLTHGNLILNYDELGWLIGMNCKQSKPDMMKNAIEFLKKMTTENVNNGYNIYCTCGENGILYANKEIGVHQLKIKPEYTNTVTASILSNSASNLGAGDVTAGGIIMYETISYKKPDLAKVSYQSSAQAIRHLGYKRRLLPTMFESIPHLAKK